MVQELSKSFARRASDRRFATKWFAGEGIDIGAGDDSLNGLLQFFPLIRSVRAWDQVDGDAVYMDGVVDGSYDFVHSSHCLEHLSDPAIALGNWIRICRPGGYLIITVPDEDLYEQGIFPSTFNGDHQWTFTIGKILSWSSKSISLIEFLTQFVPQVAILKIELLDSGFRYGEPRQDQTLGTLSESAIEIILRKRTETVVRDSHRMP
jgi:SAM-dependent methyltransferase